MDNNVYPLFVLFQNKIFVNIYMNKIYVYKNRLYQIEFKKFQFDTAPFLSCHLLKTFLIFKLHKDNFTYITTHFNTVLNIPSKAMFSFSIF